MEKSSGFLYQTGPPEVRRYGLRLHGQLFSSGEFALIRIERKELLRAQVQCGRHMKNIKTPMSIGPGVLFRQILRQAKHLLKIAWRQDNNTVCQVGLKLRKGRLRIRRSDPLPRISGVPPSLKPKRLAKFVGEKSRNVKWFAHGCGVRGSSRGV
jgi:hypothetical protein